MHALKKATNTSDVSPQACVDSKNNMVASTGSANDAVSSYAGVASKVVQITLCYQWDLAQSFPFLKLGKNSDGSGSGVLQAATAFRTEPYTTDLDAGSSDARPFSPRVSRVRI